MVDMHLVGQMHWRQFSLDYRGLGQISVKHRVLVHLKV
jgi:hypothetical protein